MRDDLSNLVFVDSKLEFWVPEILILIFYLLCGICVILKNPSSLTEILIILPLGYMFFIIERKTYVAFSKKNNMLMVLEKMLFVSKYKIKSQFLLSNIKQADVVKFVQHNKKGSHNMYKLNIINQDGTKINLFDGWATSNKYEWQKMADKINHFIVCNDQLLILNRSPFFFRLCFGIPITFFYFFLTLCIMFPNGMKPVLFHFINFFAQMNGYHLQ